MSRIVCILPQVSQYDVLHHFTYKVGEALSRRGHEVKVLSYEAGLKECVKNPPDCMVGFNGSPVVGGSFFLCDLLDIPYYAFLVDPPYYYLNLIQSAHIRIFCDDAADLPILKGYGYENPCFFTQGVEQDLTFDPAQERDLDVVFFASYFGVEAARQSWNEKYSKELCKVMDEAVDMALKDENLPLHRAFETALGQQTHLLEGIELPTLLYWLSYVHKGLARIALVQSLADLPIHIWDKRWEKHLASHPGKILLHDAANYRASLEILKRAKIVLCNSVRSTCGCNERVLNSLACGALPVTNANPYFRENFVDGEHLLMYTHSQMGHLEESIRALLTNEEKRRAIVEQGRDVVMDKHTWDARIQELGEF